MPRRAACSRRAQDADQEDRPERCRRFSADHAHGMVPTGARQVAARALLGARSQLIGMTTRQPLSSSLVSNARRALRNGVLAIARQSGHPKWVAVPAAIKTEPGGGRRKAACLDSICARRPVCLRSGGRTPAARSNKRTDLAPKISLASRSAIRERRPYCKRNLACRVRSGASHVSGLSMQPQDRWP